MLANGTEVLRLVQPVEAVPLIAKQTNANRKPKQTNLKKTVCL